MYTVRQCLALAQRRLSESILFKGNPTKEAILLYRIATGCPAKDQNINFEKDVITSEEYISLDILLERRCRGEPFAYISGVKEFWSLPFRVAAHQCLIPRPDSESILESILLVYPDKSLPLSVLDLGTGSGCLLLATLSEFEHAHGVGIDTSPNALKIAQKNAYDLDINRVAFFNINWNDIVSSSIKYDAVICNPPYLTSEQASASELIFEPQLALDGGVDGLSGYRSLVKILPFLVKQNGHIFIEIGFGMESSVISLFHSSLWRHVFTTKDLEGRERCIVMTKL